MKTDIYQKVTDKIIADLEQGELNMADRLRHARSAGPGLRLAHELTHWTKHRSRLDREFGRKTWGDEGYAREELVAELGAAFLCADLGLTPEAGTDHAAYIQSWLKVLKNDKRAIFSAAAYAQKAADYLDSLQPKAETHEEKQGVAA